VVTVRKFTGRANIVFTRVYTSSIKYTTLPFTIESFSHYRCGGDYSVERADVEQYIVLYTIKGAGILEYSGREYEITENQVIFIDARIHHKYKTGKDGEWEYYFMLIDGVGVKAYYDTMFAEKYYVLEFFDDVIIKKFMDTMLFLDGKHTHQFEFLACKHINELLIQLSLINSGFEHFDLIPSLEYVEENYGRKISIDDLARASNMSKYHFIRKFKSVYLETPYNYITRVKVNKAKAMLSTTDVTVDEISKALGFNDTVTFIRAFKKLTGITPNGYRKSNLTVIGNN
jgi:AraC-like DNA-binding protein